MTAIEAYELTTHGGATDFARLIRSCESLGLHCLIGDLAVDCYVEPVYSLDAEIVLEEHIQMLDLLAPTSQLRIQFTKETVTSRFLPELWRLKFSGFAFESLVWRMSLKASFGPTAIRAVVSANARKTNWILSVSRTHPELKSLYPSEPREQLDHG